MSIGRVKYARNGDIRLAYREMGDGDIPVVLVPGWVSNVDLYDDPTTPMMARMMWQAVFEIDVRDVLSTVRTPTMVLARRGDRIAPFEAAQALAAAIPKAELRELRPARRP